MTYTTLAVISVVAGLAVDRWVLRTRLTSTATWWMTYAIIVFFQLLTNGWLTGREIVRYRADAIIGDSQPQLIGDGRLFYAPVEDLGFGFGLVLIACSVWVRLGRSRRVGEAA